MLLNHQTNPLVTLLGRCRLVVCVRRRIKKVLQLHCLKFAGKDLIWTNRLSEAQTVGTTNYIVRK